MRALACHCCDPWLTGAGPRQEGPNQTPWEVDLQVSLGPPLFGQRGKLRPGGAKP